jgi:NADH dehydrogenase
MPSEASHATPAPAAHPPPATPPRGAPARDPEVFASTGPAQESPEQVPPPRQRIVIVGGGAGGLELAARLHALDAAQAGIEVLLIDSALTHVWKPLLHEIAAGTQRADEGEVEFLQLARRHGFRFQLGTLQGLDRANKQLWLAPLADERGEEIAPRRAVAYDVAVIAVGSVVNPFGTPGVAEHAATLDEADDAHRFHRRLLAACARAELKGGDPVDVVIVGGGATGVELAAELTDASHELARFGTRLSEMARPVRLHIVEAGPRLVAALPEDMARKVLHDLQVLGVDVLLDQRVKAVHKTHVELADGRTVPAELTVWAAGIQGPPVLKALDGLALNKQGQLEVLPTLQTTQDPDIFALGDCASCRPDPEGAPVPPRAQAARQEAHLLAEALLRHLRGSTLPSFSFHDQGAVVSLGRQKAIGRVAQGVLRKGLTLEGVAARLAYWGLQRRHMVTLHGGLRTMLLTLGGWLAGRSQPRVKLH